MIRNSPVGRRMVRVLAQADLELALMLAMLVTATVAAGAMWAIRVLA